MNRLGSEGAGAEVGGSAAGGQRPRAAVEGSVPHGAVPNLHDDTHPGADFELSVNVPPPMAAEPHQAPAMSDRPTRTTLVACGLGFLVQVVGFTYVWGANTAEGVPRDTSEAMPLLLGIGLLASLLQSMIQLSHGKHGMKAVFYHVLGAGFVASALAGIAAATLVRSDGASDKLAEGLLEGIFMPIIIAPMWMVGLLISWWITNLFQTTRSGGSGSEEAR